MTYLRTLLAALTVFVAVPVHAQPATAGDGVPEPAKISEARTFIGVMFPASEMDKNIRQMLDPLLAQMQGTLFDTNDIKDAGLRAVLDRYLRDVPARLMPAIREHFPQILEATAVAYAREFTLDELKELNAFARTPTGAHYLTKVTAMLNDPAVSQANRAYLTALGALQQAETNRLRQEVEEYLATNPEAVRRLGTSQ